MKTLFRSSGSRPAASRTSTGTVAVRPIVLEVTDLMGIPGGCHRLVFC